MPLLTVMNLLKHLVVNSFQKVLIVNETADHSFVVEARRMLMLQKSAQLFHLCERSAPGVCLPCALVPIGRH